MKKLREDAKKIIDACLDAAAPGAAVMRSVKLQENCLVLKTGVEIDLRKFNRIVVVGAGKASAKMAKDVEALLGGRVDSGLVCVKYGHGEPLESIRVIEAGHPIPDSSGAEAARQIVRILESLDEKSLVISCISGGGSALLPGVPEDITLEEKQDLTSRLLGAGADIHEINAVRKHVSIIKGGNLTRVAFPALVLNLMLSDVVGDNPDTIASGPFAPDQSTFQDALDVLARRGLAHEVSDPVLSRLQKGAQGIIPETTKPGDKIFDRTINLVVGSNFLSLSSGIAQARALGYQTLLLSSTIEGDTVQAALFHAAVAREIRASGNPATPPACILSGGETTVVRKGSGTGGRNQHFALALVKEAALISSCLFASVASDGTDGPTDAAGAIVDSNTLERALDLGLDADLYLANNDSYNFFRPLEDLVVTGPTRTNVMDFRIILVA